MNSFNEIAVNSIWIQPGQTSIAYKGIKPGRSLRFIMEDIQGLKNEVEGIEHLSARMYMWENNLTRYKGKFGNYQVRGTNPENTYIRKTKVLKGRYLNQADVRDCRKVVVLSERNEKALFNGENPVGNWITIRNIAFLVVGVCKEGGNMDENDVLYVPITTAQKTFNGQGRVDHFIFTTGNASLEQSNAMLQKTIDYFSRKYTFDPKDERAARVWNSAKDFGKIVSLFDNIRWFIWLVGLGTIIAGVVGIGNIMLISVKERTKEIGVRKALGATPTSIVSLIMMESIVITFIAGYIGLFLGMGALELVSYFIAQGGPNTTFDRPEVSIQTAFIALSVLVGAGALAGYFPARKASLITPVEALR
jgi:putative ABC transport system permease protein